MSFKDDIDKFVAKTNMLIDNTYRQSCKMVSEDIAEETPVSTGRLLGSWAPSADSMGSNSYSGGMSAWSVDEKGWKKDESIANANRAAAMADVMSRISSVTAGLNRKRPYYFTNDVDYVRMAEHDGWAAQGGTTGPYRMREKAILNWQAIVNEAALTNV
jgi:hypothetical protein